MANKEFLQAMNGSYGAMFDKKVDYMLVYDYGVTYGTIFNNMSNWIKNDLEDVTQQLQRQPRLACRNLS